MKTISINGNDVQVDVPDDMCLCSGYSVTYWG